MGKKTLIDEMQEAHAALDKLGAVIKRELTALFTTVSLFIVDSVRALRKGKDDE